MHGNNLGTLHQYLHEDILPAELGGSGKTIFKYQIYSIVFKNAQSQN